MRVETIDDSARSIFGRRKIMPRACIADPKRHIRSFLADALEDLGFITSECSAAGELAAQLAEAPPDLLLLGLGANGTEARNLLQILAAASFDGKVLPVGPRESVLAGAVRQLGLEFGIAVLPTLTTPFSAGSLRESVAALLPRAPAPSPAIDVAEALKAGWLELWYQQKINLHTLEPRGAEALLRLRHPAWGVVPPAGFIPDDTDPNLRKLSEFVIGRVVADWHDFMQSHGPIELSINLPAAFLRDPRAIDDLTRQLPAHPAFGGLLIEITAAEVLADLDFVAEVAREARFHNVAISIDDLGADWPALLALRALPFAEFKVDRNFVTGAADDRLKQTVCRGIIELAARFGVRTIAEGVESRADFTTAHQLGFELAQGYLFGKPMGVKKFARAALSRPVQISR